MKNHSHLKFQLSADNDESVHYGSASSVELKTKKF